MVSLSAMGSLSEYDSSDLDSENDGKWAAPRSQQSLCSSAVSVSSEDDDLITVTVEKTSTTQKAGIGLVERKRRVYICSISKGGLFDQTDCQVGDIIMAVNGIRLNKELGAEEVVQIIAQATTEVTLLLRKARKKVRSSSQPSHRRKRSSQKSTLSET
jgi:C-terminal processing protease CtpA/Prc